MVAVVAGTVALLTTRIAHAELPGTSPAAAEPLAAEEGAPAEGRFARGRHTVKREVAKGGEYVAAASRQIEITEPTVVSVDGPNFLRKTAVA